MTTLSRSLLLLLLLASGGCLAVGPHLFEEHSITPAGRKDGPRILAVVAHPDDEILFAGTFYKTSTLLGGACDVALITNGEGGYKYSTLSEPIYGEPLTEEPVGRALLPDIRREEFLSGCSIMRVRKAFLLNQQDHRYTQDVLEVLGEESRIWDLEFVTASLLKILRRGHYDFVFTLTPVAGTHGHHKASVVLALRAVQLLPPEERPVVLCARTASRPPGGDDPPVASEPSDPYTELEGFPITRVRADAGPYVFDRTQPFGFNDRLNLKIIANWAIAEHKSQGTMQLGMNRSDLERYFVYDLNPPDAPERAAALFQRLEQARFPSKK